jgi:hypothetical protein
MVARQVTKREPERSIGALHDVKGDARRHGPTQDGLEVELVCAEICRDRSRSNARLRDSTARGRIKKHLQLPRLRARGDSY